jgi:hypothetical protein
VDVGCGVGGPLRAISEFSGASVTGVNNNDYQARPSRARWRHGRRCTAPRRSHAHRAALSRAYRRADLARGDAEQQDGPPRPLQLRQGKRRFKQPGRMRHDL